METDTKKSITIFIGSLANGGAERVVANLANYLNKSFNVTVLTLSNVPDDYNIHNEINRRSLSKNNDSRLFFVKNIQRFLRLRSYILEKDQDAFIVFLPITTLLLLMNRRIINAPIIISERNDPRVRYDNSIVKRFIMKLLYPKAEGFVFQTHYSKNYYKDIIGNRGVIIPNAVNEKFIDRKIEDNIKNRNKIVAVGRLTEAKNYKLLLNSFAEISKKHKDKTLHIFGDGPQKEDLIDLAFKLKIADKVVFEGYRNNIEDLIIGADLFVLTSNYEGMPNALIEALALGIPCISTDCSGGGPKFLIENGVNGFLVTVGSELELIEKMNYVLTDNQVANNIANNGRKIVDTLSPEKIYSSWTKYIYSIIHTYNKRQQYESK